MKEITPKDIQKKIYRLPDRPPFMLDADLAEIYHSKPNQINQAVRRNPKRFPEDFCFRLTEAEVKHLRSQSEAAISGGCHFRSQNVTAISKMSRSLPRAFTRMGANQLSAVLKSDRAAERSVMIMRAFSAIEERLLDTQKHGSLKVGPVQTINSAEDILRYFEPNYRSAPQPPAALPEKTLTLEEWAAIQEERAELYRFKCGVLGDEVEKTPLRRPITIKDRQEIIDLHRRGFRNYEISAMTGRHKATVRTVLRAAGVPPANGVRS